MPEPRVPPLGVWIAAGALVLLLIAAALGTAWWAETRATAYLNAQAVALLRREWAQRSDSVQRVVVLGTSQVGAGVQPSWFFDQKTGGRWRVVRIFRPGANLASFTERSAVFDELARYPPNVLCVEENLLLLDRIDYWAVRPSQALPYVVVQWIFDLLGLRENRLSATAINPDFFDVMPDYARRPKTQIDTLALAVYEREIRERRINAFAPVPALERLRRRGTRLVLLHLPRPARLETLIDQQLRQAGWPRQLAAWQRQGGMEHWKTTRPYAFREFVDNGHFTPTGSREYSTWLAARLLHLDSVARSR